MSISQTLDDDKIKEEEESRPDSPELEFVCPKDGVISQDDVVFLCNNCEQDELEYRNGAYMCPSCLKPGENFQCMLCDSKKVTMRIKEKQ